MSTYRTLSLEELELFEKEFREYLAINGIDAELWKSIKANSPEKVNKIIESFSDVIYNSVLHKMEYIEFATKNDIKYFYYGKEKAELIGLQSEKVNLTQPKEVLAAIEKKSDSIQIYRTTKAYSKKREEELFFMLKNGCQPCEGEVFRLLKSIS